MSVVSFPAFVNALDAVLRAAIGDPTSVAFDEKPYRATWTRGAFGAGVERRDLSVRAWIALSDTVAREFDEPLTQDSAQRLGMEFAALLAGGEG